MNWLDFILAGIIILGIIRGLMKGFILEVSSFIGVIAGILAARLWYINLASQLQVWLDISLYYAKPLAFITIFFATVILFHLIAVIINKLVKAIALGWLNRLLGAIFGGLKLILILCITITVIEIFNAKITFISGETTEKSILYKPMGNILPFILPYFQPEETHS
jgi:membrane protein required for colicin V production